MSARHALFPGTFDPPTLGHLDLVERAALLFGRVTIALAEHPTKTALLPVEERAQLWERCVERLRLQPGVEGILIARLQGLVVSACRELGCDVIVRGVRNGTDFDYEAEMAGTNHALAPAIPTVLLATRPALAHITGTLVRQIAAMGGDVSALVPPAVAAALARRFPPRSK